ncbi:Protein of unknown function [Ligilactobacillus sp. WC1T17]|uniref:DUF3042 family protein n=1 Tax=Ligilactobacillus ruminis TaxID=1623 RepID=A0ABY1ABP2_9LACO|nr:Protein of unknown function [Ligilactobacillus ruminis]
MKTFGKGFVLGAVAAFSTVAGCVYAFRKTVVEPIEEREAILDEHRRRAMHKRRSAHLG